MPYVPPIGATVRLVESRHTTNWTRIDVGRLATVTRHHVYSSQWGHPPEQGPRVLVLVEPVERLKRDGKCADPWHVHPESLELVPCGS